MNEQAIHPSAVIGDGCRLGPDVSVGPFAVIENDVIIGAGCRIGAHAVVHRYVRMGERNAVHPHAVLGGLPQDLGFDPNDETWLQIGDDNVFREGVTVNRATNATGLTVIGSRGFFMSNSHVGHDCRVGDDVILASGVALGGHVEVGDRVFFGGGAMVHQFCRVGRLAMLSGLSGVRKDVLPFSMLAGEPAYHYRVNLIGLRRAGLDAAEIKQISRALRRLRDGESLDELTDTPQLAYLKAWLAAPSRRGITGFIQNRDSTQPGGRASGD